MHNLEFKILVLESLQQALKEISSAEKSADVASISAQITAIQLKIVAAQKQLAELNKKKALATAQPVTAETVSESKEDSFIKTLPKLKNKLKGGKGDKLKPEGADPTQLKMGLKIEMEHTKDKEIALEIVLDHLAENEHYYSDLKKMEAKEKLGENIMNLKDFYFDDEKIILKETKEKEDNISIPDFKKYLKEKKIVITISDDKIKKWLSQRSLKGKSFNELGKLFNKWYIKNESILKEVKEKEEKVPEITYDFKDIDLVNWYQLHMGIRVEETNHPNWDKNKIEAEVVKNLEDNPVYYTDLSNEETLKKLSHGDKDFSMLAKVEDEPTDWKEEKIDEQQAEPIEDLDTPKFKDDHIKPEKVKQLKESLKDIIKEVLNEEYHSMEWPYYKISKVDGELYDENGILLNYPHRPFESIEDAEEFLIKNDIRGNVKGYTNEGPRKKVVKEDRLSPEDADYSTDKKGIYAYLKKNKAGNFTKLIKSLEEIDTTLKDISEKKKELTKQQDVKKSEHAEQDEKLRQMVLDLFDAEESANTLYVEANGSLLTLAKKTDKNIDSKETNTNVDYKAAWDAVTDLYANTDIGLVNQMNELLAKFTTVTEIEKKAYKRNLSRGVKEESILKDVLNEFKLVDLWNNFITYFKQFNIWKKVFGKKLDITNQIIEKL